MALSLRNGRIARNSVGLLCNALPFGTIYSPNITPDQATGIAHYSDADWLGALHRGVGRDGKHLYPAMPYASYTRMSDEDALAIQAYLMSLAPVSARTPDGTVRFPFNVRWLMVFWNVFNNPDRRFEPDGNKSVEYNRGAYLVQALGDCGERHTPRNIMMGSSSSRTLAGADIEGWQASNLTSDPVHGLGTWTDEQLAQYLSTGQAAGRGPASGPMAEAVEDSLRYLTREDIRAMVVYLRDVPPQVDGPRSGSPAPRRSSSIRSGCACSLRPVRAAIFPMAGVARFRGPRSGDRTPSAIPTVPISSRC